MKIRSLKYSFLVTLMVPVSTVLAADAITAAAKDILSCQEVVTGLRAKLKVETTYTGVRFPKSYYRHATKRTIEISVNETKAKSTVKPPPFPIFITAPDVNSLPFLNDDYVTAGAGPRYYRAPFYDTKNGHVPSELLKLKATILDPKTNTFGQTLSHYSVNLILPERRLQNNTFTAYGYMHYHLTEHPKSDYPLGLAQFECTNAYKILECLTPDEGAEIKHLEAKHALALLERPGCEKMWGPSACLIPNDLMKLRNLKQKTQRCSSKL